MSKRKVDAEGSRREERRRAKKAERVAKRKELERDDKEAVIALLANI